MEVEDDELELELLLSAPSLSDGAAGGIATAAAAGASGPEAGAAFATPRLGLAAAFGAIAAPTATSALRLRAPPFGTAARFAAAFPRAEIP